MVKNDAIKDSGSMRSWQTGSHRDAADGKGRVDLIPLKYASMIMDDDPVLANLDMFMDTRDVTCLVNALKHSINTVHAFRYDEILDEMKELGIEMRIFDDKKDQVKASFAHLLIEVSKQYEDGAKKYNPNNWRLGIPVNVYISSGGRHYLKTLRGDIDEPHYRGFVWNLLCAMWTADNLPEMNFKEEPQRSVE